MSNRRIEHVVVLMLENRSFDHIFGFHTGVNGLTGNESNLFDPDKPESADNLRIHVSNAWPYAVPVGKGPLHSLNESSVQLCNNKNGPSAASPAKNNGFVKSYRIALSTDHVSRPTTEQVQGVMEAFAPSRLPAINALADGFCLCDNWFAEVPGPTHPNRLYVHAATSAGFAHNVFAKPFDFRTIYNSLQDAGFTWATYDFDDNEVRHFTQVNGTVGNFRKFETSFAADVQSGQLPNYSFILPRFLNAHNQLANSQHAPEDARHGDNLIADVYDALRSKPDVWAKTVFIVTYDEHGGFYDHVVPPADNIPNPDGLNSPQPGDATFAPKFAFDRLGFRVPTIIASPWVKKGLVDSTRYQHTSVLATLKELFGLSSFLTARDASANSFTALFSALATPRTDTPLTLPRAAAPATFSVDDPMNPANRSLDDTQLNMLVGALMLTQGSHPEGVSLANLPTTQGEASDCIRLCYEQHFRQVAAPMQAIKAAATKSTITPGAKKLEIPVSPPTSKATTTVLIGGNNGDVQALFADITKMTPRDERAERAFLASKIHMVRTHPTLDLTARQIGIANLSRGIQEADSQYNTGPIPGGVGYGMFYNAPFKTNWTTGTAIYWEIVCPTPPGGNVNTFLYLTATNRSGKGVEAFISYNGQNQTFFKVFDWARYPEAPWQTNIPFSNLANYVRTESAHGHPYQVLPLMNFTYQSAPNHWYNQVWLWNHSVNRWDLIYQFDYSATLAEQQGVWVGSWAPIVETFQNPYLGTNPMGALNTQIVSRDSNNQWGTWHPLGSSDSNIRTDNNGFHLLFLDSNCNWTVNS